MKCCNSKWSHKTVVLEHWRRRGEYLYQVINDYFILIAYYIGVSNKCLSFANCNAGQPYAVVRTLNHSFANTTINSINLCRLLRHYLRESSAYYDLVLIHSRLSHPTVVSVFPVLEFFSDSLGTSVSPCLFFLVPSWGQFTLVGSHCFYGNSNPRLVTHDIITICSLTDKWTKIIFLVRPLTNVFLYKQTSKTLALSEFLL